MSVQFQLGVFIIIATPARVAQYSYDKARLLAATPFGWLVPGLIIGKSQVSQSVSLSLSKISLHIFSTFRQWLHNYGHAVWLCVWHARLLCKCNGFCLGIGFGLCRSSPSLQQKVEYVVESKPEMAGIRSRSCKLHCSIDFWIHPVILILSLIEGERLTTNNSYSYLTFSPMGLFQCSICGKSSILILL